MTKRYRQAADYATELREEAASAAKGGCWWLPLAVLVVAVASIAVGCISQ